MKNATSLSLWITVLMAFCTGCNSNKNLITYNNVNLKLLEQRDAERVNGDQLIEAMQEQRFQFNKILIKNGLNAQKKYPGVISIINRASAGIISFNGVDYNIMQNKIVGVSGIKLSPVALITLSEKIVKLDQIQQYYCEQANLAYQVKKRDMPAIKEFDRQYFAALRSIRLITFNMGELARKPDPFISIELFLAKIKPPDSKIEFKRSYTAEVE